MQITSAFGDYVKEIDKKMGFSYSTISAIRSIVDYSRIGRFSGVTKSLISQFNAEKLGFNIVIFLTL
jgi:hypothetical protein